MNEDTQKVALPAFLRKKLTAFRQGSGDHVEYIIYDRQSEHSYRLQPWQFFILEVLPGCDNFNQIAHVFEDRFGHPLTEQGLESVFEWVAEQKLFGLSALTHPLLADFNQRRKEQKSTDVQSGVNTAKSADLAGSGSTPVMTTDELPAGVKDVLGMDEAIAVKGWKLFDPTQLLKWLAIFCFPFRGLIYLLPVLLLLALGLIVNHSGLIAAELVRLWDSLSLLKHVLLSLITVNVSVVLVTAMIAQHYRATTTAFCLIFYLGFFPRFMIRIGHVEQLSRRERIILHAGPLLMRLGLFSASWLIWFNFRQTDPLLAQFMMIMAMASGISFFLTINPLVKSNGYHLVASYLNEPHLRGKAYKALLNKWHGQVYQQADRSALIVYALLSMLFMLLLAMIMLYLVGHFLKLQLGSIGIVIAAILALNLLFHLWGKFQAIGQAYERAQQFERWRKRTLPDKPTAETVNPSNTSTRYILRAGLILFGVLLFLPYTYEPSGFFVVHPYQRQEITLEISGVVAEVFFNGGEKLAQETVIANLSNHDDSAQVRIYNAKIEEQEAHIRELKARPRPEEVKLAEESLQVEIVRAEFSLRNVERLRQLYAQKMVAFDTLDNAEKDYQVDLANIEQRRANLELVKLGVTPDQLDAEQAKLAELQEEKKFYEEKVNESIIKMPFNGTLIALHLKQKVGSFLDRGAVFAVVENTDKVYIQTEIPQTDILFVKKSAPLRFRPVTFQGQEFTGIVETIDDEVIDNNYGKVVRVIATFDNPDGILKSGMTGYAKIVSVSMPVWEIFTRSIVRFFKIEAWSWIP